jgi:glycosyltransferase involved in cell wall biosynthesis
MSEGRWGLRDIGSVSKSLDKMKPEIIHIQYPTAGFGNRLGPQLFALKKSCVVTLHEVSRVHILRQLSLYPFAIRPQHIIFTSEHERQFAKNWLPCRANIMSVIPVGSNIEAVPNADKRRSQEIAYFGLIAPRKGLEQVLELGKLIRSAGAGLKIRIIGNVDRKTQAYYQRLRCLSQELPIIWDSEHSRDQVATRLASCSIAYLPFPDGASERRTSLKAMLSNGVVTVTTHGAHTPSDLEGIVRFSTGPEDAFAAIQMLTQNPIEQERLRRKGIEYVQQFSWKHIADLHLGVYEMVMRSHRLPRLCLP